MTTRTVMRVACALAFAALGVPASAQSPFPPSGHWVGAIQVPGQAIDIEIDLAAGAGGTWKGTITIPAQKVKSLPLSNVTVTDAAVTFEIKGGPGEPRFKGTYAKEGETLAGHYTQGGNTIPFSLTRKGDAQFDAAPASAPVAKELEGTWEGSLDAGGKILRLVLKLANQSGAATGLIVSVDQNGLELPVETIVQAGSRLTFLVRPVNGSYEGDLKDGQLVGIWKQGEGSLPLVFKRAAAQ